MQNKEPSSISVWNTLVLCFSDSKKVLLWHLDTLHLEKLLALRHHCGRVRVHCGHCEQRSKWSLTCVPQQVRDINMDIGVRDWDMVALGASVKRTFFEVTYRRRQWQPTPILLPGKSHGRRSLVSCSPWGRWGLDTTEWLHFHFSLSHNGEGNGNPLQCSCLENPRDGRAW